MTSFNLVAQRRIDLAASLLEAVGRRGDARNGIAALHSLEAAALLRQAGARWSSPAGNMGGSHDVRVSLREALRLLSLLPAETFASTRVVDAVDAAQRAYQASS